MLPANPKTTPVERCTALYALDVVDLRTAAMLADCPQEDIEALLSSPNVEAECIRLQSDGKVTELRATFGLDTVVERLVSSIGQLDSQTALIRTGEFLVKASGQQERRSAALRATADAGSNFVFQIVIQKDDGEHVTTYGGGSR